MQSYYLKSMMEKRVYSHTSTENEYFLSRFQSIYETCQFVVEYGMPNSMLLPKDQILYEKIAGWVEKTGRSRSNLKI